MELAVKSKIFHPHLPLLLLHGNPWVTHVAGAGEVEPRLAHHHLPQLLLNRHDGRAPGAAHCRPRARPPSSTAAPESLLIFRESSNATFSREKEECVRHHLIVTNSFPNATNSKHERNWKTLRAGTHAELHLILNWESLFCFRPSVVRIRHADSHTRNISTS